jgi:hypothetical protein
MSEQTVLIEKRIAELETKISSLYNLIEGSVGRSVSKKLKRVIHLASEKGRLECKLEEAANKEKVMEMIVSLHQMAWKIERTLEK